jgi:hypothetical protein
MYRYFRKHRRAEWALLLAPAFLIRGLVKTLMLKIGIPLRERAARTSRR